MTKSFIKSRTRFRKLFAARRLETGFSMLEAVVVVGVLLALAVGGFFSYGSITKNAKMAAAKSAVSSVYTSILIAQSDGDPSTNESQVVDQFNASNNQFYAEILPTGTEATVPAMSTTAKPTTENDFCVRVTNLKAKDILAEKGQCPATSGPTSPTPTATPTPTDTVTPTPTPTETVTPTPTPTPTETIAPTPPPAPANVGYTAAWGDNAAGPFGNNSTTRALFPVESMIGENIQGKAITAVEAGPYHSCVIADGVAYCAGGGGLGQLGNGANLKSLTPVAVTTTGALAGKTVTAIAPGQNHTCAIADGTAYCWGHNSAGQLGNGTTTNSNVPTAVKADGVLAGKTVTSITSGYNHSCAVANDEVFCWGYNGSGQVGNSSTTPVLNVPVAVTSTGVLSGKKVTSVENGNNHSCAIADSKVFCWGENGFGQISGTLSKSTFPIAAANTGDMSGKAVTSLAAGESHTCAIADGKAYCWGSGTSGEIGNGANSRANSPVAVSTTGELAGKTVTSIAPGKNFTCAVAGGKAYCWGSNTIGQGGHATTGTTSNIPVAVADNGVLAGKTLISIAASENYATVIYS